MKILTLDIETSPNLADVWSLWNQNVSLAQLRESSRVLCWAAKWYGKPKVLFGAEWTDKQGFLFQIHDLLSEADVVVTYNGDRFDLPTLNKEFILLDQGPPDPYQSVDLYKTVRKQFKFTSNKLDYVSQALELGSKVKHSGHSLWTRVLLGEEKAQREMMKYCKHDVTLTEALYEQLLPWIPNHPNRELYSATPGCTRCGGQLTKRGFVYAATGKYQSYRCKQCGGWSRDVRRSDGTGTRSI